MTRNLDNETSALESREEDGRVVLGLLKAIDSSSSISQRAVAQELGIALGLANSYLKRCVRKGLIKIQQAPANRYLYYLTPKGFAEKSRLTTRFLSISLNFYRAAREECQRILDECTTRGWSRIALYGNGMLCEIFSICQPDSGVTIVGVVDRSNDRSGGLYPVSESITNFGHVDAVVICRMEDPQGAYYEVCGLFPEERIFTAAFFNISKVRRAEADTQGSD